MKLILVFLTSLAGSFLIYLSIHEWYTLGTVTVHGKGLPAVTFAGKTIWLGFTINSSMALFFVLAGLGWNLFESECDKWQSLGLRLLSFAAFSLACSLALYFCSYGFWPT